MATVSDRPPAFLSPDSGQPTRIDVALSFAGSVSCFPGFLGREEVQSRAAPQTSMNLYFFKMVSPLAFLCDRPEGLNGFHTIDTDAFALPSRLPSMLHLLPLCLSGLLSPFESSFLSRRWRGIFRFWVHFK
jgi:hypothetical protein